MDKANSLNPPFPKPGTVMESSCPTMNYILAASRAHNLYIRLQSLGLFFRITARNTSTRTELGKAEWLIRVWTRGKVWLLYSMRLRREGRALHDCGCGKADLLVINDSDLYHSKLARFYGRIGFVAVHEVTGRTMVDLAHMLVWGGVGTRMDADVKHLLGK